MAPASPAQSAQVATDLKDLKEQESAGAPAALPVAPSPLPQAAPANVIANFAQVQKDQNEKKPAEPSAQAARAEATDSLKIAGMRTVGGILTGVVTTLQELLFQASR